jgi:hypothetical protein
VNLRSLVLRRLIDAQDGLDIVRADAIRRNGSLRRYRLLALPVVDARGLVGT